MACLQSQLHFSCWISRLWAQGTAFLKDLDERGHKNFMALLGERDS
jgi:hypothetical protein